MGEFAPEELHAIGLMRKASKTLPDDMWLVAGMQELACLYVKIEPLLTDVQKALLIGVGGLIAREAEREMRAGIQAFVAIEKAREAPTQGSKHG